MPQDYQEEDAHNVPTSSQPSGYESSCPREGDSAILSHDYPTHISGINVAIPGSILPNSSSTVVTDSLV